MSDAIPEKFMTAAREIRIIDPVQCQDDHIDNLRAIARAIMAAAEAATKRERERCISVVRGISDRHTLAASSCHLDGEKDAAALASYCARSIDDIAAILKGDA